MLSLPPQLLRALPWQAQVDQPFVRSNSARPAALWSRYDAAKNLRTDDTGA
jgi:hypothetical protein